jgi:VWFA-related protein
MITPMGLRSIALAVCSIFFLSHLPSQTPAPTQNSASRWTATIQVLVRDKDGHPLAGLGPDDFTLTEDGTRDTVLQVRSLSQASELIPANLADPQRSIRSAAQQTSILLVLAPMSASGREYAITGLLKLLNQPIDSDWSLGLIDDAGIFTPFAHDHAGLRARLQELARHLSPPQYSGSSWPTEASRAIQELAIRPGRHAIVFASDFESNVSDPEARDQRLVRFGPSDFVSDAGRAQAAMYTVRTSGPRVIVPFGGAADEQYSIPGELLTEELSRAFAVDAQIGGDFLYAARASGGLVAADMQEALADVAADAAGYYQITFIPSLKQTDGAWHPISVSVPGRHVRLRGPRYYLAPISDDQQRIQSTMLAALKNPAMPRLDGAAHVWLFPDSESAHTVLMAADFVWPAGVTNPRVDSQVQIFAQLVNQSLQQVVGAWINQQQWKPDVRQLRSVHWQRETPLYPGLYSLRVVAMDQATGTVGTREFKFAIYPPKLSNLHLSDIVLADGCLTEDELQGRMNLLDPLLLEGCLLSPSASASFSSAQSPTMMVRLYARGPKLRETILKQWKAYLSVGDGPRIPVSIDSANIRGLVVTTILDLKQLNLKSGPNPIEVAFEAKADDGSKHTIAIRSQLTLTP